MTKSQLEEMLTQALQGLEEMKQVAIRADKERLSAMNPIAKEEYKALPAGEVGKVAQPAKKPYTPPERKAVLSGEAKAGFIAFATTAIKGLHVLDVQKGYGQSVGIHSVYSGFNALIKEEFGLDCYQSSAELLACGFGIKPVKGGVRLYLPEDAKGMQNNASSNRTAKLKVLLGL